MNEPTDICTLVKNSEYCTEQMKPPKRDYFEWLCSGMLEVTVNIPGEKQYASKSNHIWGHKRHIYFRNGTLTITLDDIAMQLVNSEFSIACNTYSFKFDIIRDQNHSMPMQNSRCKYLQS